MLSFTTLLKHQWLEYKRSSFWQRSIGFNIFISILLLYLTLNFVALGWAVDIILKDAFPELDPIRKFTEILFYYFSFDLVTRFILQDLPVITISPYLHLPVKRNTLFNYLLLRSVVNFFNLIPLLLILPFFFKVVVSGLPGQSLIWLTVIILLILFNNYITFFLKKIFNVKPIISLLIILGIAAVAYLDFSGSINVSRPFGYYFFVMMSEPFWLVLPFLMVAGTYLLDKKLLSQYVYQESGSSSSGQRSAGTLSFFGKVSKVGALALLEVKLIMRNARPKTMAVMSLVFILYGFIFYGMEDDIPSYGFLMVPGFFVTSLFMLNHGQLILSWDSAHFDFILIQDISAKEFLTAKYRIFFIANTFFFIITLPYGLFGNAIYFVNTCMYLYSTGVTAFLLMLLGTHSTKRIELTKSAFFNYEGFSAQHYLVVIPALGLPFLIFWPFQAMGFSEIGVGFLGLIGLIGILFGESIITRIAEVLRKRKYIMSQGFRNS